MKKLAILLNGPPGSGKDEVASMLLRNFHFQHAMFKDKLYEVAMRASGVPHTRYFTDRELKEIPRQDYLVAGKPMSPRDYLIYMSENVVKPIFGEDAFGKATAKRIIENPGNIWVLSDSGFEPEMQALKKAGIKVIVVKVTRPGCTFEGDSRDFLSEHDLHIDNIGTLKDLEEKANYVGDMVTKVYTSSS
jgi:hypothetical protein